MIGIDAKHRWVKDFKMPIAVLDEPYFSYFVELYEGGLGSKTKYKLLLDEIKKCGSEQAFLDSYYEIKDSIISRIHNTDAYHRFNTMDMSEYSVAKSEHSKSDVFKVCNENKCFISIDLVKANFQALKFVNSGIVLGCDTYSELLNIFTDSKYMVESKYLRQVIFGVLNPTRTVKVERSMTQLILEDLLKNKVLDSNQIKMICDDEIVAEIKDTPEEYNGLREYIKDALGFDTDIEVYKLRAYTNDFLVKEFLNKSGYEIMKVPKKRFAQAYKVYNGISLNDYDLTFIDDGKIVRYLEPCYSIENI